jgi:poly-gamma-glutamate synthesis protein (capsule biosynthesis protein)
VWFIGDIALGGLIASQSEKNEERFKKATSFFANKPFIFANLETPIFIPDAQNPHKKLIHTTNQEALHVLKELNVFAVSLANNHIFDCTERGVQATIDWLDKNGILHTGAGSKKEDLEPLIFYNEEGKRVAFFAYVDKKSNPHCEESSSFFINYLDLNQIKTDLEKYRSTCDLLIVSIHWGIDYIKYVSKSQIEMGKKIIDFGADLIVGHHNHVIQPFLDYKGKRIFFGLGGIVFGDYPTPKGMESTFQRTKKGLLVNLEQNQFKYYKSSDQRGNIVTVDLFSDYESKNKKWWKQNLFFLKNPSLFVIYQKFEIFKMKVFHFFFSYQNSPINRLLHKLRK